MLYCNNCKVKIQKADKINAFCGVCLTEELLDIPEDLEYIFSTLREKNYPVYGIDYTDSDQFPIRIRLKNHQCMDYLLPLPKQFVLFMHSDMIEIHCTDPNPEESDELIELHKEITEWLDKIPKVYFIFFHYKCTDPLIVEKITRKLSESNLVFYLWTEWLDDDRFYITAFRYVLAEKEKPEILVMDSIGKEFGAEEFISYVHYSK